MPTDQPKYKTCKRYNTPGDWHYLTFSCFQRRPFLSKDRTCRWLADAISEARTTFDFRLVAYVFMPEHVHLIIRPKSKIYDISEILYHIKQPVSRKARKFVEDSAPQFLKWMLDTQPNGKYAYRFWQRGGGYDRNIFTAEELWEKIAYIHKNPVRRCLVQRTEDWIWSSAAEFAKLRAGPIPVDCADLPWLSVR